MANIVCKTCAHNGVCKFEEYMEQAVQASNRIVEAFDGLETDVPITIRPVCKFKKPIATLKNMVMDYTMNDVNMTQEAIKNSYETEKEPHHGK